MCESASEPLSDDARMSAAIKRVRLRRGFSTQEVADRMNITLRTYQRFEAGRMASNLDLMHRFAKATDSDPHALWFGVAIGSADLAPNSADNQFVTVLVSATHRFEARYGERIARLSTRAIIDAVTALYDRLGREIEEKSAKDWLKESEQSLAAVRPRPGRRG